MVQNLLFLLLKYDCLGALGDANPSIFRDIYKSLVEVAVLFIKASVGGFIAVVFVRAFIFG
jgi:hypothetical protein